MVLSFKNKQILTAEEILVLARFIAIAKPISKNRASLETLAERLEIRFVGDRIEFESIAAD